MRKNRAEPRLAMIRIKAMATKIFIIQGPGPSQISVQVSL
jgi:hypothetical protein